MHYLHMLPIIILAPIRNNKIKNNVAVWVILAFILLLVIAAYAFYCTSKGWDFAWTVKIGWPKSFNTAVKCTK